MKAVNPRLVPLRDQFRFRRQPMLHLMSVARTLIHISEKSFSGHFIR